MGPCARIRYGSEKAGARKVGVMGTLPPGPPKNACPPNIPGDIGMGCGKTNFVSPWLPFDSCCWCSPVGGVALPLLMASELDRALL